jgi:hypothetical protein
MLNDWAYLKRMHTITKDKYQGKANRRETKLLLSASVSITADGLYL